MILTCALTACAFINGFSQGLINNGAHIITTPGAFIYVDGGSGTGNFLNQDAGAFTGTVENQGVIDITGEWNNLSAANVFNASTGTVILSGTTQFIQGTSPTHFNNLILSGSGTKTLNIATLTGGGFAAPAGVLDLTALVLDLNGYRLTVNNPATTAITHTTGYIISETSASINPSIVQWNMGATNGSYVYPFGVSSTQIPFTLNKTSGVGNVSVSTRATALSDNLPWQATVTNMYSNIAAGPGEIPVVIDRWWDVDPSSPVTASMIFTYRGVENTTTYSPTGTFSAQNWNSIQWLPPVGSGVGVLAGTGNVTVPSQLLSSTPWVLANLDAPLPIELLDFSAKCNSDNRIDINWSTATEINNKLFTIERSHDGMVFELLTEVASQGNGTHIRFYSFTDEHPFDGITFYRLSQTDADGKVNTFNTVSVKSCTSSPGFSINAWHHDGNIHIMVDTPSDRSYNVSLYDAGGRLIFSTWKDFFAGSSEATINTGAISNGVYFLSLKNSTENLNYKVLKGN